MSTICGFVSAMGKNCLSKGERDSDLPQSNKNRTNPRYNVRKWKDDVFGCSGGETDSKMWKPFKEVQNASWDYAVFIWFDASA